MRPPPWTPPRSPWHAKAAPAAQSTRTGVVFGKYFINGRQVTREEFLAYSKGKQKPEPSVRRDNPDLDEAMGAAPAAPQKPPADIRHNPALDELFGDGPASHPEPERHPSRHNPDITYGHADDRDSDDAHFDKKIRAANAEVRRIRGQLKKLEGMGTDQARAGEIKQRIEELKAQAETHTRNVARLRAEQQASKAKVGKLRQDIRSSKERERAARAEAAAGRRGKPASIGRDLFERMAFPERAAAKKEEEAKASAEQAKAEPPPLPGKAGAGGDPSAPLPVPPPLPHHRTHAQAWSAANKLVGAARSGKPHEVKAAHAHAVIALHEHEREGHKAIDRQARAKYGDSAKGRWVAAKAKREFGAKITKARDRMNKLLGHVPTQPTGRPGVPGGRLVKGFGGDPLTPLIDLDPDTAFQVADTGDLAMEAEFLTPYRAKLMPGTTNHYGYMLPDVRPVVDAGRMTATVTISTQAVDRSREVLRTDGIKLDNHRANPVVLMAHQKQLPIGKAENRDTREYTVTRAPGRLDAVTYFDQHTELGEHGFRLVETGTFRGASIGFFEVPGKIEKGNDGGHPVRIITESDLLEYSHLLIPDNPECIVRYVEKGFGGKPLNVSLKEYLVPLIPERPPVVTGGWEPREKLYTGAGAPSGPVADIDGDGMDDDVDAEPAPLTSSSQFYHLCHAGITQLIGLIEEMLPTQENERTKGDGESIVAQLSRILDLCAEGHGEHKQEFPDQPSLPNDMDTQNSPAVEKAMEEWRQKGLEAWQTHLASWEQWVAAQDAEIIHDAVELFNRQVKDARLPGRVRATAKAMAERLKEVRMVQGQGGPKRGDEGDSDWSVVLSEIQAAKQGAA